MAVKGILEISDILNEYSHDIQDGIKNKAIEIAKLGVKELKANSPKSKRNTNHKGKYAKGWRVKKEEGMYEINCIIHNATDYQLTHLLEREHLTHNGGKYVPEKTHIAPVEERCISEYEKSVEKIIEEAG